MFVARIRYGIVLKSWIKMTILIVKKVLTQNDYRDSMTL